MNYMEIIGNVDATPEDRDAAMVALRAQERRDLAAGHCVMLVWHLDVLDTVWGLDDLPEDEGCGGDIWEVRSALDDVWADATTAAERLGRTDAGERPVIDTDIPRAESDLYESCDALADEYIAALSALALDVPEVAPVVEALRSLRNIGEDEDEDEYGWQP